MTAPAWYKLGEFHWFAASIANSLPTPMSYRGILQLPRGPSARSEPAAAGDGVRARSARIRRVGGMSRPARHHPSGVGLELGSARGDLRVHLRQILVLVEKVRTARIVI